MHGAIDVPESPFEFLLFVKNVGNECVGMNRRVRLSLEFDLHVSLSLLSPAEAVHGFVGFALHFFLPLGIATVVEFLALGDSEFAFRDTVTFDLFSLHREKRLLGCGYGSAQVRRDIPRLVALAESKRLDLAAMVSKTLTIADVNTAFDLMTSGEVIRSVLRTTGLSANAER